MSTSVIIVTYQTGPALWVAVQSALAQPECAELLVVNNGNPPDVSARLNRMAQNEPRLKIIEGQGNVGFAKACNLGAKAATGDYILLLNPDCQLPEGAIAKTQLAFDAECTTLVGCFLMNPDGSEQRGGRRELLTPKTGIGDIFRKTKLPGGSVVPAISGAFMFMRRSAYLAMGGMDEEFFLHCEDLDLCMRVHKSGGKIIWVPEVKVLHLRSTSDVSPVKLEWFKAVSFMYYFRKHFAGLLPVWYVGILLRFALRAMRAFFSELCQRPQQKKQNANRLIGLVRSVGGEPLDWLKDKTVLVTGAASQVGICTISELLNVGANVVAMTHLVTINYQHERLRWIQGSLTDHKWNFDVKADILVHTAGLWLLPEALPKIVNTGVKRVLAFSSMSAVTKQNSTSQYESDIAKKLVESENKIIAFCKEEKLVYTIFRSTMVYGAGLDQNIMKLAATIRKMRFLPISGKGTGLRQPVLAADLARAVIQAIPNPNTYGKTYELGGRERVTYRDMVEKIFKVLGVAPRLVSVSFLPKALTIIGKIYQMPKIHGEIALRMNRDMICDNSAAEQDFGYAPQGFLLNSDML